MNLLFVCSRNRLRSPTAEAIFSGMDGYEVLSAGTSPDAETVVSGDLVEWADTIFVMEGVHRRRLMRLFGRVCGRDASSSWVFPMSTATWTRG